MESIIFVIKINQLFEKEIINSIERSYFDYSLISLSIHEQSNRRRFVESMEKCPNLVVKYLFHGSQIDPISKIMTKGFLYMRKAFFGMGIYFSDILDYVSLYSWVKDYYSRRNNFSTTLPVNETFSCVSPHVFIIRIKRKIYFLIHYFLHL